MKKAISVPDSQKGIISSPEEEWRYTGGIIELPPGHLLDFMVIPAKNQKNVYMENQEKPLNTTITINFFNEPYQIHNICRP
jgi:hypothetical protein